MYMVFAGYNYYPEGGIHDLIDRFVTKEDCVIFLKENIQKYDWYHVYSMKDNCVVYFDLDEKNDEDD